MNDPKPFLNRLASFLAVFTQPTSTVEAAKRLGVTHVNVLKRIKLYAAQGLLKPAEETKTHFKGHKWVLTSKGRRLLEIIS